MFSLLFVIFVCLVCLLPFSQVKSLTLTDAGSDRRPCRQPWISAETLSIIDQKAEAHKRQDRAGQRRLQGIFRAKAKEDEEHCFNQIEDEIEDGLYRNDLRPAYRAVRRFRGFATTNNSAPVLRKDGSMCTSPDDILARWAEHYQEALNHMPATLDHDLDTEQMAAEDDSSIPTDAPTLEEVESAIKKLKLRKVAGRDGIGSKLLKLAMAPTAHALHKPFVTVWTFSKVPVAWNEGIIVSLYKGMGQHNVCSNYQPISRLSVPAEIWHFISSSAFVKIWHLAAMATHFPLLSYHVDTSNSIFQEAQDVGFPKMYGRNCNPSGTGFRSAHGLYIVRLIWPTEWSQ